MTIFIRLILAHLFTDLVIFRRFIFDIKQKSRIFGYLLHALLFALCVLALCLPYMNMVWISFKGITLNGWQTLPLLAIAHTAADIAGKTSGRFSAVLFVLWQIVIVTILFLAFPPLRSSGASEYWENFLIIVCGALFVTYFIMTLIYFIEKDLAGECKPDFDVNYANMLIRLALFLLLLAPGFIGWVLGALWVAFVFADSSLRGFDISPARIYVGLPLTVIAGALVKYFF